jgi:hypothetical protein
MRLGRLVLSYATLMSALSACTTVAPTPRQTFSAAQTIQAPVGDRQPQPVEPCLVGTRNCLSADQPPPGPCLVSTARCVAEGMRVTDAMER